MARGKSIGKHEIEKRIIGMVKTAGGSAFRARAAATDNVPVLFVVLTTQVEC